MSYVIEKAIQQYAHNTVGTHIKNEFDHQIALWEDHIKLQALDCRTAFANFNGTLAEAKIKQAEAFALAMLALSFIAGPALSWLSGTIQYKIVPKLASSSKKVREKVSIIAKEGPPSTSYSVTLESNQADYSKVSAKIFGDMSVVATRALGGTMLASPDWPRATVEAVADAADPDVFKTKLELALNAQADTILNHIGAVAHAINENPTYGRPWLVKGNSTSPTKNPTADLPEVQEARATKLVREELETMRQAMARQFYYYGNDPVPYDSESVQLAIEREIWALWILAQDFHVVTFTARSYGEDWNTQHIKPRIDRVILDRWSMIGLLPPDRMDQVLKHALLRKKGALVGLPLPKAPSTMGWINALNTWARDHKPSILAGHQEGRRRILPPIENLYGLKPRPRSSVQTTR